MTVRNETGPCQRSEKVSFESVITLEVRESSSDIDIWSSLVEHHLHYQWNSVVREVSREFSFVCNVSWWWRHAYSSLRQGSSERGGLARTRERNEKK